MTRARLFGEDSDYMKWCRERIGLPSSDFVQTDVDQLVHRYAIDGSRDRQYLMEIEVKTRRGLPTDSQADTLFKHHLFLWNDRNRRGITYCDYQIFHAGVSVLSLEGTVPGDADMWYRFAKNGELIGRSINAETLEDLLMFRIHPDTLEPI